MLDIPRQLNDPALAPVWLAASQCSPPITAADIERLRGLAPTVAPEIIGQVITQAQLRNQACEQLGPMAAELFFTESGLQQSTNWVVAQRRASLIAAQGRTHVTDLGCGIGIDSLAFIDSGLTVSAVELDPFTATIAQANVTVGAASSTAQSNTVVAGDLRKFLLDPSSAVFVDPARRDGQRRLMKPDRWLPPWSWVAAASRRHPALVAKVAPGIPHRELPEGAAVEHVSVNGGLAETTVWFPGLRADLPTRSAVMITTGEQQPWALEELTVISSNEPHRLATDGPLLDWLVEPDAAVIRSGLVAELAEQINGHLVSPGIAYITCADEPATTSGRVFRVAEVLPAKPKPLRAALRQRGVGSATIRTRGLALDPDAFRKLLQLPGGTPTVELVLTRLNGKAAALLVTPQP